MKIGGEKDRQFSQLMEKTQAGDGEAYHQLLTELNIVLHSYVRFRVKEEALAEELVQDILLGIHLARHTYSPKRPFGPWLFAIARYKFIDHVRRQTALGRKEVKSPFLEEAVAPNSEDNNRQRARLRKAVSALPDKQRAVVELLKLEGHSIKEVSKQLAMSETAVKAAAHRGYKSLKKIFDQKED